MMNDDVRWALAASAGGAQSPQFLSRGKLRELNTQGQLLVSTPDGDFWCDWLYTSALPAAPMEAGCELLVLLVRDGSTGVCLGRIGRWSEQSLAPDLVIQSSTSLALKCGEASVTMDASGRLLLKGDDVVVRAKGTKRIRAGHVAIN